MKKKNTYDIHNNKYAEKLKKIIVTIYNGAYTMKENLKKN
jgi:hypothetical protein